MPSIAHDRIGQYVKTALNIMLENGGSLRSKDILLQVQQRLKFTDYELERFEKTGEKGTETFADLVRNALGSLYDVLYLQTHPLSRLMPHPITSGPTALGQTLQNRLIASIEYIRAEPIDGASVRARRRYDLLRMRYVEGLDAPTVYQRLGISRADYYRQLNIGLRASRGPEARLETVFPSAE